MKFRILACALTLTCSTVFARQKQQALTVFTARKIVTMEPALPEATAVAVADGRIVGVGSLESLQGWIDQRGATLDTHFADKVLMPGFIDPHVHPSLPAVLTQFPFPAPDDWSLPTGEFPGAASPEAFTTRLKELVAQHSDENVPLIAWGYHELWHGAQYKPQLNAMFPDTPVFLWQRSFHEMIGNDAGFKMLGISAADFVVLAADPYEVGAEGLKDIEVWGTVSEGQVAPAH